MKLKLYGPDGKSNNGKLRFIGIDCHNQIYNINYKCRIIRNGIEYFNSEHPISIKKSNDKSMGLHEVKKWFNYFDEVNIIDKKS